MAKKRRLAPGTPELAQQSISAPSPTRRIEVGPADNVPTFYANSVNFDLTNWDIRMRLGQIQSGDASVLNVAEIARVFMSHTHARAFAKALNTLVEKLDQIEQTKTAHMVSEGGKAH